MKVYEEHIFVVFGAIIGIVIFCAGFWWGLNIGKGLSRFDEGVAIGRIQQYERLLDVGRSIKK